jgi:PAS domain S-box-containing protein
MVMSNAKKDMEKEIKLLTAKIKELQKENETLKKEQIEISEAKELYLKIFEEFPALIWRSRLDKLCDYFNKTWLEFTGRTMEQEFGNGWAEGVHPDDFDFCLQTYVTAFDKREAFLMEYRMKNKFGEYRWIRDYGRPFYDLDNSFLGYIGSCYDITGIKDNELRLIELNATKDKFFSIIAHDLRSPFNSIVGFSAYLVELVKENNYSHIDEIAAAILKSSNRAMDLLSNLMTWSQIESGRMPFNPKNIDITSIISDVISLIKPTASQKSINIENKTTSNAHVFADKEMISTILRNLLSNAIKFTENGGKVTILSAIDKNELTVTITDNGVGISKENIDKLFTINEGFSTPGTEKEKGTGLGLILCKEFIEKHHGKIWVESNVGIGSSFSFSLPTTNENKCE